MSHTDLVILLVAVVAGVTSAVLSRGSDEMDVFLFFVVFAVVVDPGNETRIRMRTWQRFSASFDDGNHADWKEQGRIHGYPSRVRVGRGCI